MNAPSDTVRRSVMDQRREAVAAQEKLFNELQAYAAACHEAGDAILEARSNVKDRRVRKILTETARKLFDESDTASTNAQAHHDRAEVLRWHQQEANTDG